MSKSDAFFPEMIRNLPQADIPISGLTSHLVQGPKQQVILMAFEEDIEVPEHSHEAQWGVVLDGEMELTIAGTPQTLRRGDSYFIPKDVVHSARIKAGYKDLTLFNQIDRYRAKG